MAVKRSISFKFSSSILTIVVIIMVIMLYSNYRVSRDLVLDNAARDVKNLTQLTINQMDNVFENIENIPEDFALRIENPDVQRVDEKITLMSLIERIKLLYGSSVAYEPFFNGTDTVYHAPYLYRQGDSIIFKNLARDTYKYHLQDWYTIPKKLNRPVWSEPYFDEGGGERLMVTYSVPFYKIENGKRVFNGVVTADLSLRHLQKLISSIQFYETGYAMLITEKGVVVTHPRIDYRTEESVTNIMQMAEDEKLLAVFDRMMKGETDFIPLEDVVINNEIIRDWISFAPIPSTGWSVAILFDERDVYAGLHSLMLKLVILGIGGLLALALIIIQGARKVTKPLKLLAKATKEIGAGNLKSEVPEINTNDEVAEMGLSIKSMQQDLISYIENLKKTTAEKEQIESEIKIASQIQMSMLPQEIPSPHSINNYGIQGYLHPAKEVGGDFYDFIVTGNKLYFAIGDVSGKGVPAALFMAKAITLFRAKAEKNLKVNKIAFEMNNDLSKYNENAMFVTFFIGELDYKHGTIEYCNAGHNPPYIHKGSSERLETMEMAHGLPLGLMPDKDYGMGKISLTDASRLFMFTDGITEAENSKKELFGDDRLQELLLRYPGENSEQLIRILLEEIHSFVGDAEQSDDITLLLLKDLKGK
ncbi:MAG: SpoIIE family protein phosphatase [Bacteroidota bacterium]|nr:SpoIIE family protein phosphatase [Bacteroidota bacterium]